MRSFPTTNRNAVNEALTNPSCVCIRESGDVWLLRVLLLSACLLLSFRYALTRPLFSTLFNIHRKRNIQGQLVGVRSSRLLLRSGLIRLSLFYCLLSSQLDPADKVR